ncbi:hypothetical protein ACS0TY_034010 [Phlomoides rotata]
MSSTCSTSNIRSNVRCWCGIHVVQCTSWSDANPGRRFMNCEFSMTGNDCKFFQWIDDPMCQRST